MSLLRARESAIAPASAVPAAIAEVENLNISFPAGGEGRHVVRDVSFTLHPGRVLAFVGESGSGKSVTARALLGLVGDNAQVRHERLRILDHDYSNATQVDWRRIRGAGIGYVLQDALTSLDPLKTVGFEVGETVLEHRLKTKREIRSHVVDILGRVGIPDGERRYDEYPHQLSGGLRQRALIAAGIAAAPRILIADEPTTALDVSIQVQVLRLLKQSQEKGLAILLITHDLTVASTFADEILVFRQGEVVERGTAGDVLSRPRHAYTKALLQAIPGQQTRGKRLSPLPPLDLVRLRPPSASGGDGGDILEVRNLTKTFHSSTRHPRVAVDHVSFSLEYGRTLGIVGESGSGKSTVARIILGFEHADSGEVLIDGKPWSALPETKRRPRRHLVQLISQDPLGSFDPRHTVLRLLGDALGTLPAYRNTAKRDARSYELLELVGLERLHALRRPRELSGGQRQRVAIARALAVEPRLLVADEAVSALDVSIQAQILDVLRDIQKQLGLSILFISHDLGVVQHISDSVVVMKAGRVVEHGDVNAIFSSPKEPYTRELLNARHSLSHFRPAPVDAI
ncbi:dipeptide ABC transporter ATP-binding protein [Pseudochelatococcus contaminans]|uniref:Peptide/nickel transport system ATP-binding protein n=1 Tax=Pseudochelatococcus contaminans TaxID=1538103 RepID=A0A7W5Z517_9HYPH|nr:ABC transporter ATP-binding protein [Pseudochelatococcus contaminans]MBB3810223.1 peptide/nickel transport system ATP-binding protein [Pseudochelatococcus contaminans]